MSHEIRKAFEEIYSIPKGVLWSPIDCEYKSIQLSDEAFVLTRMLDAFKAAKRQDEQRIKEGGE